MNTTFCAGCIKNIEDDEDLYCYDCYLELEGEAERLRSVIQQMQEAIQGQKAEKCEKIS